MPYYTTRKSLNGGEVLAGLNPDLLDNGRVGIIW